MLPGLDIPLLTRRQNLAIVPSTIDAPTPLSGPLDPVVRRSSHRRAGFVAALKNSPPRARYVVMDEADEFMPENVGGGDTRLFGDLKWIVRRGRIDGWRMLMVTQRPQDIAKSVLTQCETLVIHKLTAPQDRKAVEEWVKGNAEAGQAKEVLGSLARGFRASEANELHEVLSRVPREARCLCKPRGHTIGEVSVPVDDELQVVRRPETCSPREGTKRLPAASLAIQVVVAKEGAMIEVVEDADRLRVPSQLWPRQ